MTEAAQHQALGRFGAHALMHAAMQIRTFGSEPDLSDRFITELVQSGAYQVSTLSVLPWTFPFTRAWIARHFLTADRVLEAVAWSVRDGVAKTPAEWMSAP